VENSGDITSANNNVGGMIGNATTGTIKYVYNYQDIKMVRDGTQL